MNQRREKNKRGRSRKNKNISLIFIDVQILIKTAYALLLFFEFENYAKLCGVQKCKQGFHLNLPYNQFIQTSFIYSVNKIDLFMHSMKKVHSLTLPFIKISLEFLIY